MHVHPRTTIAERLPADGVDPDRMSVHWLFAHLGKRVLRPGGVEMTRRLLDALDIGSGDDVVELGPGMGSTTRMILERNPASYTGVDRDPVVVDRVSSIVEPVGGRVVRGMASHTGLDDASTDVAFGEAYLTMQPVAQKERIVAELHRIIRPGGRVALHEMAFRPGTDVEDRERLVRDLRDHAKVQVTPLSEEGWKGLLTDNGFEVKACRVAPLHLLEPARLIADEGFLGALMFVVRTLCDPHARSRVLAMRRTMGGNADKLQAIMLTAVRID